MSTRSISIMKGFLLYITCTLAIRQDLPTGYKHDLSKTFLALHEGGCPALDYAHDHCKYDHCHLSNASMPEILDDCYPFFDCMCNLQCVKETIVKNCPEVEGIQMMAYDHCATTLNLQYTRVNNYQCHRKVTLESKKDFIFHFSS